jgi:hypothetical protein
MKLLARQPVPQNCGDKMCKTCGGQKWPSLPVEGQRQQQHQQQQQLRPRGRKKPLPNRTPCGDKCEEFLEARRKTKRMKSDSLIQIEFQASKLIPVKREPICQGELMSGIDK